MVFVYIVSKAFATYCIFKEKINTHTLEKASNKGPDISLLQLTSWLTL